MPTRQNFVFQKRTLRSQRASQRRDLLVLKALRDHQRLGFPKDEEFITKELDKFTQEACEFGLGVNSATHPALNRDHFHQTVDILAFEAWCKYISISPISRAIHKIS